MLAVLLTAVLLVAPPDSTQEYYAMRNVPALQRLCADALDDETELLCRYRLYPLTEDENYVKDLPTELPGGSARAQALLSGLWGYRAARASLPMMMRNGLRASRLMDAAQAQDPDEPFVLLIEGQSLLFRPGFVGGDDRAALDRFRRLYEIVSEREDTAISPLEAELWIWYALDQLGDPSAPALREELLARQPPPLYRQFLLDPP